MSLAGFGEMTVFIDIEPAINGYTFPEGTHKKYIYFTRINNFKKSWKQTVKNKLIPEEKLRSSLKWVRRPA